MNLISIKNNEMITSLLNKIRMIRKLKRGHWVKTAKKGWVNYPTYYTYLVAGIDLVMIREEIFK